MNQTHTHTYTQYTLRSGWIGPRYGTTACDLVVKTKTRATSLFDPQPSKEEAASFLNEPGTTTEARLSLFISFFIFPSCRIFKVKALMKQPATRLL
jgi:hypothetical protein